MDRLLRRFFAAGFENRFSTPRLPPKKSEKKERISRFIANPESGF